MTITSIEFVIFTLAVLALYYALPSRAQNVVLLIASIVFLVSWNIQFALVYIFLTVANYVLAMNVRNEGARGRFALYLGITINVLALGFFKYANFFVPNAVDALDKLGLKSGVGGIAILLPVGLSFFVVQVISYLVDVSRGTTAPITDPIEFSVYMAYFPRVVSGPIERPRHFLPHLQRKRVIDTTQIAESVVLLGQGLLRKVVIANLLFVIMPSAVFSDPHRYSSPELAIWLLAFAFALYNDFAGYTLIVRGISGLFGIPLSLNFNAPYLARSFTDLWRRWHISLSDWLRDYIYMPATRFVLKRRYPRTHAISIVLPPMFTMFVSALWHDLSLTMLVWGGLPGVYLQPERTLPLILPAQ